MNDPQTQAVEALAALLARASREQLDATACGQMVELCGQVPGWIRRVAQALSAQRSAPGVDALCRMQAGVPGVVEGLYHAFTAGVVRKRRDGSDAPLVLAIDFRRSRASSFEDVLTRAQTLGDAFEVLEVDSKIGYRIAVFGGRGTLAGRASALAQDLQWLHQRLAKLKGTRLWLNGWQFTHDGAFRAPVQQHLVRAWLGFAATQTQTVLPP